MSGTTLKPATTLDVLPAHARVWVYKCDRALAASEVQLIRAQGAAFTATWAAHGAALDACVEVLHDRFVVVAVDEEQARASGCSIDKSVGFIKQLEQDLGLMLTDRMVVVYEAEGKVRCCRLQELPDMIKSGIIASDTIVFDDLVSTVADLRSRFRVPIKDSWMSRYL